MSLAPSITSVNSGTIPYVANVASSGADPVIATAFGGVFVEPRADGNAFIHTDGPAGRILNIGANGATFANIVLTDATNTMNKPTNMLNGGFIPAGQTLTNAGAYSSSGTGSFSILNSIGAVAGANPATATLDTYTNRDIHGYSDTGYSNFSVAFIAGGGAVANPVGLSPGLYSVIIVPSGGGNENAQASAICYWSGAVWSGNGVSFNFTGGVPNLAIGPVAGGATLNIGGASAGALAGNVLFRQLLATP